MSSTTPDPVLLDVDAALAADDSRPAGRRWKEQAAGRVNAAVAGHPRDKMMYLDMTGDALHLLSQHAYRHGMSRNGFVRWCIIQQLRDEVPIDVLADLFPVTTPRHEGGRRRAVAD